ncbi:hypothetical protein, partial [Desulfovibrio piger]|uniref:hypothetical protein n=1 Tax=Desulfovibrio piger TaxID=901 RepID=UPI0026F115DB
RPLPENGLDQAPAYADTSIPQTTTGITKKGGRNPALFVAFLLPIRAQIAANSAANLLDGPVLIGTAGTTGEDALQGVHDETSRVGQDRETSAAGADTLPL